MAKALPKIVIGLGNYGDKYAYVFHNMGFIKKILIFLYFCKN